MSSGDALIPDISGGKDEAQRRLLQFLQENVPLLLGIISSYVVRMGLAHGEAVQAAATDVLQDTVFEALKHADRFDPDTQPRAWLLAISVNVLKRKKTEAAKRYRREVLMSDLPGVASGMSESDFFDRLMEPASSGPEQAIEMQEQIDEMLARVSTGDQEILRLALVHDLDTNTLAQALGMTPGAARVRLHRALNRLRKVWINDLVERKEEQKNG